MLRIRRKPRVSAKRSYAVSTAVNRMPRIRRRNLPPALLDHLLDRVRSRDVAPDQLEQLARWLDGEPEVPTDKWFKRFRGMIVCAEGEFVKTFLRPGQIASGEELE